MRQVQRRRLVLAVAFVGGAVLLRAALDLPAGDGAFPVLLLALAGLLAAAAVVGGPVPLGEVTPRNAFDGVLVGAALFVVFLLLRWVLVVVPPADRAIDAVLRRATAGDRALVLGAVAAAAIAEEMFFRGALHGRRKGRILGTTAWYVLFTAATGRVVLILAAGFVGLVLALQRRTTKGIFVPAVTHVTWELLVVLFLPR